MEKKLREREEESDICSMEGRDGALMRGNEAVKGVWKQHFETVMSMSGRRSISDWLKQDQCRAARSKEGEGGERWDRGDSKEVKSRKGPWSRRPNSRNPGVEEV